MATPKFTMPETPFAAPQIPYMRPLAENNTDAKALILSNKDGSRTLTLYYSFQTVIGFRTTDSGTETAFTVSENVWGKTTGRHINVIPCIDAAKRLPYLDFYKALADACTAHICPSKPKPKTKAKKAPRFDHHNEQY